MIRTLVLGFSLIASGAASSQQMPTEHYAALKYRHIGPVGNRVISVIGVPGDPAIYYAGAASGGIFKTVDGGVSWSPIFDDQPVSSIGALAVSPSDPNVVWAGTGETFIRSNVSIGNGIYKSTDAGATWVNTGLEQTGRIGRVLVHPGRPDVVFACAMGHSYGPQPERGVFRTTDGGETWVRVHFVNDKTGCSDLAMDPHNPRILFAGMWQLEIHTSGRVSGGPGSGLFMSRDGGDTWTHLTGSELPKLPVGKIAICTTRRNSNRIYALIETGDGVPWRGEETESGELWRSDDGAKTWKLVSHDRDLAGRTHYYSRCTAAPDDENEVYFMAAGFNVSRDGGETSATPPQASVPGWDHHDLWIDPLDGDRMIAGHDGGLSISTNRSRTWHRIQLPVAQMYHVAVDNQIPYYVYGNRQDGPSIRGPSNSRLFGSFLTAGIPRGQWHAVGGGESGYALPDPVDPDIIWASASGFGSVGGIVERFNERTRQGRQAEIWPESTIGWGPAELKYRFNWSFPIAISPHDRNTIYAGSQHVHRTTDGGNSWQEISPDLSTNDKSRQQSSGGLTPDNVGVEYASLVFALAESPLERGVIWAGTNDGLVQVTRNGGDDWTNVTPNIPDLPAWGTVSNIEPSRHAPGTAYITVDFHQVNNRDPYVYKTTDYGRSWKSLSATIPKSVHSYAHCVREDPVRAGLLYLGTENALYVSFDDGANWQSLQTNLPHAPVHWLVVQEHFSDLVVATYGRGFWILDDITPLRQLTDAVTTAHAHLFEPRAAYRFQPISDPMAMFNDPSAGENPPYGASINYHLQAEPAGDVTLVVFDAAGDTVRALEPTKTVGINRTWWDLRYAPSDEIKLRTSPLHAPHVRVGEKGWRESDVGRLSILAPPGTYTVKLTVEDREYTRPLEVRKDPNTEGSEADIDAQFAMLTDLRRDLNTVVAMINNIERVRGQVYALTGILEDDDGAHDIRSAADSLDKKFITLEEHLLQMKRTGRGQDIIRYPSQLADKIMYLAGGVATNDFPPTTQQRAVHRVFKERIAQHRARLDELLRQDLAAFNNLLRQRNLQNIIAE